MQMQELYPNNIHTLSNHTNCSNPPLISSHICNTVMSQLAVALFAANPPLPGIVLQNTFDIDQSEVDALAASVKATQA